MPPIVVKRFCFHVIGNHWAYNVRHYVILRCTYSVEILLIIHIMNYTVVPW